MVGLGTLVSDVYGLFTSPHKVDEDLLSQFAERLKTSIRESLDHKISRSGPKLRLSNYGLPARKLWFKINSEMGPEKPSPEQGLKFLVGDVMEQLLLYLVRESGTETNDEGKYVEVDGVRGKLDVTLSGIPVDVKTASGHSFKKFASGEFLSDNPDMDPYGYKYQIAGYTEAEGASKGAFLVFNKENAKMCIVEMSKEEMPDVYTKISESREMLDKDTPPVEKCYPDEPQGKSGNRVIARNCSFCEYKYECWKDANGGKGLVTKKYAHGPVDFSVMAKEPNLRSDKSEDDFGTVEGGFTVEK